MTLRFHHSSECNGQMHIIVMENIEDTLNTKNFMLIKEFRVSFSGFNVTKVKIATFHYDSSPNGCLHPVHAQFESKILNGIY